METVTLSQDRDFSLAAAAGFGFGPRTGQPEPDGDQMALAFMADDLTNPVGAVVRQRDGVVTAGLQSAADSQQVQYQLRRILSLDQPGGDWLAVADRDPVIGHLQRSFPGLRPVLFHSPYEAAAWSLISARRHRAQGQAARNRIAAELGTVYELGGQRLAAFPSPAALLAAEQIPGVESVRAERLRRIAAAALEGLLDPAALREAEPHEALARLQSLPGIGPFYANLILLRATGVTDVLAVDEPLTRVCAAHFYGLDSVDAGTLADLAENWRPFRTWCMVLLRVGGARAGVTRER